MASKFSTTAALFLAVNLLFFTLTTADYCPPKHPKPNPKPYYPPKTKPTPKPYYPPTTKPTPKPYYPPTTKPTPMPYYPPTTKPTPMPYYPPSSYGKCPIDALKLGVCANVLNGLISAAVGHPSTAPCCTLIHGLADLDAAVCLCTAIKANILGINLDVPVSLSLLANHCGCNIPEDFIC